MQVSKRGLDKQVERRLFKVFYRLMADLKNPKQVEMFLGDVLTETERVVLAKRLTIAVYLNRDRSYEKIRKDLKVSSATIANVQKMLENGGEGFNLALKTIEAEEWASEMADKISASFKKVFQR